MMMGPILDFDVLRDDHALLWQDAIARLAAAIRRLRGTHEAEDVLALLHFNRLHMHLWHGQRASAVTDIQAFPRKRVLNVFLAGGRGGLDELIEWTRPNGVLEEWAFDRWQCDWITYTGRKGWGELISCDVMGEVALRERG